MSDPMESGTAAGKGGRWSKFAARAAADRDLGEAEVRVLVTLGIYAGPDGIAWPSQELLALVTGFRRETVCRAIGCLLRAGYLDRFRKRTARGHLRNVYRLLYPPYVPPRLPVPEM